jgi:hypothetical protein
VNARYTNILVNVDEYDVDTLVQKKLDDMKVRVEKITEEELISHFISLGPKGWAEAVRRDFERRILEEEWRLNSVKEWVDKVRLEVMEPWTGARI